MTKVVKSIADIGTGGYFSKRSAGAAASDAQAAAASQGSANQRKAANLTANAQALAAAEAKKIEDANLVRLKAENTQALSRLGTTNQQVKGEAVSSIAGTGLGGRTRSDFLTSLDQLQSNEFNFLKSSLASKESIASKEAASRLKLGNLRSSITRKTGMANANLTLQTGLAGSRVTRLKANSDANAALGDAIKSTATLAAAFFV